MLRRILSSIIVITMSSNILIAKAENVEDIQVGRWYSPYASQLTVAGSLTDVEALDVKSPMSKLQFISIVLRASGVYDKSLRIEEDVTNILDLAYKYKLAINTWDNSTNITRGEAAYVLNETLKNIYRINLDKQPNKASKMVDYSDIELSPHRNAIINVVEIGIFNGDGAGNYNVNKYITISEAMVVIARTINYFYTGNNFDKTYSEIEALPPEYNTIFSDKEITEALGEEKDKYIDIWELNNIMYDAFGMYWYGAYNEDTRTATIGDLLDTLHQLSNCKIIQLGGNNLYIYPGENTAWLSNVEWAWLNQNRDRNCLMSIARIIASRTQSNMLIAKRSRVSNDSTKFTQVVDNILPEYSSLVHNNIDSIDFWLENKNIEGTKIYEDDFEAVLHELQHEDSADRSGVETTKDIVEDSLIITLNTKPGIYNYYNSKNRIWVDIESISEVPFTNSIIHNIPTIIKESKTYQLYASNANIASNTWGIYGIQMEFCSYNINLRSSVVLHSFGARKECRDEVVNYLFWRGLTLQYLVDLKNYNIDIYNSLIEDSKFVNLIIDNIDFGEKQLTYIKYFDLADSELQNMYSWAFSNNLQSELDYLRALYI